MAMTRIPAVSRESFAQNDRHCDIAILRKKEEYVHSAPLARRVNRRSNSNIHQIDTEKNVHECALCGIITYTG